MTRNSTGCFFSLSPLKRNGGALGAWKKEAKKGDSPQLGKETGYPNTMERDVGGSPPGLSFLWMPQWNDVIEGTGKNWRRKTEQEAGL